MDFNICNFLTRLGINWLSIAKLVVVSSACVFFWGYIGKLKIRIIAKINGISKHEQKNRNLKHLLNLIPIISSVAKYSVLFFGIIMCCMILGITVSPMVYFLSLFGVAFSFGSKDLITDLISGVLILVDGKTSIGDFVTINESNGFIETMTLRKIEIRHLNGCLESFQFSKITNIKNYSSDNYVFGAKFTVIAPTTVESFHEVANNVFKEMKTEKIWSNYITKNTKDFVDIDVLEVVGDKIILIANASIKTDPQNLFASEFSKKVFEKMN